MQGLSRTTYHGETEERAIKVETQESISRTEIIHYRLFLTMLTMFTSAIVSREGKESNYGLTKTTSTDFANVATPPCAWLGDILSFGMAGLRVGIDRARLNAEGAKIARLTSMPWTAI